MFNSQFIDKYEAKSTQIDKKINKSFLRFGMFARKEGKSRFREMLTAMRRDIDEMTMPQESVGNSGNKPR